MWMMEQVLPNLPKSCGYPFQSDLEVAIAHVHGTWRSSHQFSSSCSNTSELFEAIVVRYYFIHFGISSKLPLNLGLFDPIPKPNPFLENFFGYNLDLIYDSEINQMITCFRMEFSQAERLASLNLTYRGDSQAPLFSCRCSKDRHRLLHSLAQHLVMGN